MYSYKLVYKELNEIFEVKILLNMKTYYFLCLNFCDIIWILRIKQLSNFDPKFVSEVFWNKIYVFESYVKNK